MTRVLEERRDVRSEEVLPVAPPNDQRRSPPRTDQDVRFRTSHHDESERTVGERHHLTDSIDEGPIGHLFDQVCDHLGVGVALELVTGLEQLRLEVDPVLDDPVVNHDHIAVAVEVGMGVSCVGGAVSGPPCVTDPGVGLTRALPVHQSLQVGDSTGLFQDRERPAMIEGDPCRVVAPVFESGQTRHQDVDHGSGPDVSNNSAHISFLRIDVTGRGAKRDPVGRATVE